jgi:hypothetical protein
MQKQTLDIVDYSGSIQDFGTVGLTLHLDQVDLPALETASNAANRTNNPFELLGALGKISLGQGSFYYEEQGIIDRVLQKQATAKGVDPATLKQQILNDLGYSLRRSGFRDPAGIAKLKQLVQDGKGRITFNFAPPSPVNLAELTTAAAFGGPQAVVDKLQLQIN